MRYVHVLLRPASVRRALLLLSSDLSICLLEQRRVNTLVTIALLIVDSDCSTCFFISEDLYFLLFSVGISTPYHVGIKRLNMLMWESAGNVKLLMTNQNMLNLIWEFTHQRIY